MLKKLLNVLKVATVGAVFTAVAVPLWAQEVKIGFLVKQPEEPWFQDEWKFAEQAAKEKGFTLVKIGVPNAEKTISAIESLAAQKAQGFIICTPDVKLGKAIVDKAKALNLKLFTVDDRLVGPDGKIIESVPHMGISAYNIGKEVGVSLLAEAKKRGWNLKEVGVIKVTFDQLPTIKERTDGATDALKAGGFPVANIITAPQQKQELESASNAAKAVLTRDGGKFKYWLIYGGNDSAVMGAVRATEERGIPANNVIGVGINGGQDVLDEFKKSALTGFYGSILLGAKRHGYESSILVFEWIKSGKQPALLTQTSGKLINRQNVKDVRKEFGLE